MMLFDSERQFLLFFPRIFNKNVFFFRQPVRLKSLLVTFQNVKNSLRRPPLMRPKKGLQTHTFNSKRKYPIHRNNLYTGNTDLAVLLNKDTFEPNPLVFAFKEDSTSKGTWVWSYSSFEAYCDALHFPGHKRLHFALYTFTMSWPRNVTLPLIFNDGYMAT